MALAPVQLISDFMEDYPNYWLKMYEQGTTTPITMAINKSGTPTVAKAEISAGPTPAKGLIKTAGNVTFIPYVDEAYDAYIFPTEAEADANDTANAIQLADDVDYLQNLPNSIGGVTGTEMIANTALNAGDFVETVGRLTVGDGGDSGYEIEVASGSPDGGSRILLNNGLHAVSTFPGGRVLCNQFGTVGDNVADDTTPIQSCLTYLLSSGRRGTALLLPGNYRTTATITINGTSIRLEGEAADLSTIITADHLLGPVVRVIDRRSGISNLEISASATRAAGALGSNYGILLEPADTSGGDATHSWFDNILVQDQPNVGILASGRAFFATYNNITLRDNKSHGIQFDNGAETGRTNLGQPGEVIVTNSEIFDNAGNGIVVGNDNAVAERGFRFVFTNVDLYRNADSAGTRKSADQMWAFMDTSIIQACAFDGKNLANDATNTRGILIFGRSIEIKNTRFLNVINGAIRIGDIGVGGYFTRDIKINTIEIFGEFQANLDPVITIDSAVGRGIDIDINNTSFIVSITDSTSTVPLIKKTIIVPKLSDQAVNNSAVLVSDNDLKFALLPKQRVQFKFVLFYRGSAAADIKFTVLAPAGANIIFAPSNSLRISGSDTIGIQSAITGTSSFTCGSETPNSRMIEIIGEVLTTGTAGDITLQWAQASAVVADTEVINQSHLVVTL